MKFSALKLAKEILEEFQPHRKQLSLGLFKKWYVCPSCFSSWSSIHGGIRHVLLKGFPLLWSRPTLLLGCWNSHKTIKSFPITSSIWLPDIWQLLQFYCDYNSMHCWSCVVVCAMWNLGLNNEFDVVFREVMSLCDLVRTSTRGIIFSKYEPKKDRMCLRWRIEMVMQSL